MNNLKQIITLILFSIYSIATAQNENAFLDRDYWKTNTSIEDIELKINEGNDISELNKFAFDAVSWALIEKADNKTVKFLLSKKGNGVNKLTHDGRTYIFWAAYKDNLEMMQFLIDKGANPAHVDSHGYSLLNFAAVTGQLNTELYDFCINNGANVKEEKNLDGANALLLVAPFLKDTKLIEYFISKGIDLDDNDNNGNGIFNYAAKSGNVDIMNLLIKKGVSYKTLNNDGGNAIIFASQGTRGKVNSLKTFQYLEKLGINPNITTKKGVTPLHSIAYRAKDLDVISYFVDKGVNVNQVNDNGSNALQLASYNGNLKVITYLQKHTKNINALNNDGKSALTNAIQSNTKEIAAFLIKNGADILITNKEGNNLGYYLANLFDVEKPEEFNKKLKLLTNNGFDFTTPQENGNTLFHLAIDNKNIDLLKLVKTLKVDVNAKNKSGMSPLHKAAMESKDDTILKYLLSIGANKTAKTNLKETVYDLAKENELLQLNNVDLKFLK